MHNLVKKIDIILDLHNSWYREFKYDMNEIKISLTITCGCRRLISDNKPSGIWASSVSLRIKQ